MINEEIIQDISAGLRGTATEAQQRNVEAWLKESAAHREEYQEYCQAYYQLTYAAQWPLINVRAASYKVNGLISSRKRRIILRYICAGVAALLAVFFAVNFLLRSSGAEQMEQHSPELAKSGEKKAVLTLANGQKMDLSSGNVKVDLDGAVAVGDGESGLKYSLSDNAKTGIEYNTLSVPRGGEYRLTLSDGTRVWLNSETELKYPVVFNSDNREVFVSGEAFFEVTKDANRCFIVHTERTTTTVRGTSFNVMAYREESMSEITLVEGLVDVQAGQVLKRITPGRQVCVDNRSLGVTEREVNVSFYSSWKDGLFDFEGLTLEELAVKLGRWYDVDFFFVNKEVRNKKFTGAVKRNNTLEFMLDFVEKTSDVRFDVKGKTVSVYNR